MQPRHSSSEIVPDRLQAPIEYNHGQAIAGNVGGERSSSELLRSSPEQSGENKDASADDALQMATAMTLPQPLPSVTNPAPMIVQDDVPVIAADEDLIEKEWVDKAKKIITETKDDPYRREQEIAKLQIDYIKKRYGRVIGETPKE